MNYIEIHDRAGLRRIPAGGYYTLGRAPSNDVVLYGAEVSRNHARLVLQGDHVLLEDIGSTHGTFINGRPLSGPSLLHDGDQIKMGDVWLIYRYLSNATAGHTPASTRGRPTNPPGPSRPARSRLAANLVRCVYCGAINLKNNTVCYHCSNALLDSLDTPLRLPTAAHQVGGQRFRAPSSAQARQAGRGSRWLAALLTIAIVVLFCLIGLLAGVLLAESELSQGGKALTMVIA